MAKKYLIFVLIILKSINLNGQRKHLECSKVKDGVFYYSHLKKNYIIIRKGKEHKEVDLISGDTTYFNAEWVGECLLNLKYLRNSKLLQVEDSLLRINPINLEILKVENNYYIFKIAAVNSTLSDYSIVDTLWYK